MSIRKSLYSLKRGFTEKEPLILTCLGIAGFIGTIILACKETKKAEEVLEKAKEEIEDVKSDPEHTGKDMLLAYSSMTFSVIKTYAPSACLGALTIASFVSSYRILNKRYIAASALAASLSEAFNAYRERVRDKYGAEEEEKLYLGTSEIEITELNGKKEVKKKINVLNDNNIPIYAKFFDESNPQWNKDPSLNLSFLKGVQASANRRFKIKGYLLLNEVYEMLDIPQTMIGSEVGWFEKHGDSFVSFGLWDPENERKRAFVNGYEPSILLTFNCVPKMEGDLAYA